MEVLQLSKKETHLNSTEKFYVYTETIRDNQLNDKHTVAYNRIFDSLPKLEEE